MVIQNKRIHVQRTLYNITSYNYVVTVASSDGVSNVIGGRKGWRGWKYCPNY